MQKSRCFLLEGVRKMKKINWKVIAVLTVLCILGGAYTLAFAENYFEWRCFGRWAGCCRNAGQ